MDHLLSITKIFKLLQWRCLRPATSYLKLVLVIYLFGKRIDITLVEIENFKYRKKTSIVWKVSKCGVISGPYFPVFSPNTGKYGPEKSPYLVTFHSVNFYSVRYSVNSVRYFGPIIRDLISHKLSIICKLIGKLKNGIHKCKPRKCPCRICKTFFSKHRFLQYI